MELYVNNKNIIGIVGDISWNSSVDVLGDSLSFNIVYSRTKYFPSVEINVGDIVVFSKDDKEVFRGIIVTKERNEIMQSFTCYDFAFYLNKSKTVIQFNKVSASNAIKQLLGEFNTPIGNITNMHTVIKKIYNDKTISDIIKDILDQARNETNIKYVMEMREGKLHIEKDTDLLIDVKVKIGENLQEIDISETISNPSKKASIEEMKNSIKIYSTEGEDKVKIVAEAKDNVNINKYGLLQEVQSVDSKDIAKAKNIANNLLKDLNKVALTIGFEVLGHIDLRAGRIMNVNQEDIAIIGKYKILSANHSIKNKIHKCKLDLEEVV